MNVTRYKAHKQAVADPDGRFVLYTDYQALAGQLLEECRRHEDRIRQCEQQQRELEALRARIH